MDDARAATISKRLESRVAGRRRRAAEALAADASPAAAGALARALAAAGDNDDDVVSTIAERRLAQMSEQRACDASWQVWSEQRDQRLLNALLAAPADPSSSQLRALKLFLTAQWERYQALDFDLSLLGTVYDDASAELRARLAAHARKTGRREWVQVVASDRRHDRVGAMSDAEWETTIALLNHDSGRDELWQLAQAASPRGAAKIVRALARTGWQPRRKGDRDEFDKLVMLARACDESATAPTRTMATVHHRVGRAHFVAFSPDGGLLMAGHLHEVRLWSLADGGHVTVPRVRGSRPRPAFSRNSKVVAAAGYRPLLVSRPSDWRWHGIELRDPRSRMHSVAWSEDSKWVTAEIIILDEVGGTRSVHVWRTGDGAVPVQTERPRNRVFSPDRELVAEPVFGVSCFWISVWETYSDDVPINIGVTGEGFSKLTFSPDGTLLAGHCRSTGAVELWRTANGAAHATVHAGAQQGVHFTFSPDGGLLATSESDGCVRLWRTADGAAHTTLKDHPDWVYRVSCSPEGSSEKATGVAGLECDDDRGSQSWWLWDWLLRRPVTGLAAADLRVLDALRDAPGLGAEAHPWLELTAALVRWGERHEITGIYAAAHEAVADDYDIEIER